MMDVDAVDIHCTRCIVSETETEYGEEDAEEVGLDLDDTSSSVIWRLPRNSFDSSRRDLPHSVRKIDKSSKFILIKREMRCFLSKHFSFCEDSYENNHSSIKQSSFLNTLPSLMWNSQSSEVLDLQHYKIPALRPMKKYLRRCRKRFSELEKLNDILRATHADTSTRPQWVADALNTCVIAPNALIGTKELPKGSRVEVGLLSCQNCPGSVVKQLKVGGPGGGRRVLKVPRQLLRPWSDRDKDDRKVTTSDSADGGGGGGGGGSLKIPRAMKSSSSGGQETREKSSRGFGGSCGELAVGTLVEVAKRTWSNMNKLGGTGIVTGVFVLRDDEEHVDSDDDDYSDSRAASQRPGSSKTVVKYCYNIKYPVGGREQRVHQRYVTPTTFLSRTANPRDMLGRCGVPHCPSFIADCGHVQPGGEIDRITERLVQQQHDRNEAGAPAPLGGATEAKTVAPGDQVASSVVGPKKQKINRKKLVPTKDAVRKKTCSLQSSGGAPAGTVDLSVKRKSHQHFRSTASKAKKLKSIHNDRAIAFVSANNGTANGRGAMHSFKPAAVPTIGLEADSDSSDERYGDADDVEFMVNGGGNNDESVHVGTSTLKRKKSIASPEEMIAHCEDLLGRLNDANVNFERKFISRVQRWLGEASSKYNSTKSKSLLHEKLSKLEDECYDCKVKMQRELNDALDKNLAVIDRSRSKFAEYGSRINLLEVGDSTAQERFKNLIHKSKLVCDSLRNKLGAQYVDFADDESSSGEDCESGSSGSESYDTRDSTKGRVPQQGKNHTYNVRKHSEGLGCNSKARLQSTAANRQSRAPSQSATHDQARGQSNSQNSTTSCDSRRKTQPTGGTGAQDNLDEIQSNTDDDDDDNDNDNDCDSMDDFIASDDDHFCTYSKVKKVVSLSSARDETRAASQEVHHPHTASKHHVKHVSRSINESDTYSGAAAAATAASITPVAANNYQADPPAPIPPHVDHDTLDDKWKKLLNIMNDNESFCPLSSDLLFLSPQELKNMSGLFVLSESTQYRQNAVLSVIAKSTDTRSQALECLEGMIETAKSEVDIQSGDVVVSVIEEVFAHLTDAFTTQNGTEIESSQDKVFQILFVLDGLWTQHCFQSSNNCKCFLDACDRLESFIITSLQFSEKFIKFNLFSLLRRKALWVKLAIHFTTCMIETNSKSGQDVNNGSVMDYWDDYPSTLKRLLPQEQKLMAQTFLGLATFSSFEVVAAHLLEHVHPKTAAPAPTSIPYLSDLIGTSTNLCGLHPLQLRQWDSFFPHLRLSLPPDRESFCQVTWKEFNAHLSSFLGWYSMSASFEKRRDRLFSALSHNYDVRAQMSRSVHSCEVVDSANMVARVTTNSLATQNTSSQAKLKLESFFQRNDRFLWLAIVLQTVNFVSARSCVSNTLSSPTSSASLVVKIPFNLALFSSRVKQQALFSNNVTWVNRFVSLSSLCQISTDVYDTFQDMWINMLKSNAHLLDADCSKACLVKGQGLLPWNEKCLINMGKVELDIKQENLDFDKSNDQLLRCKNLERLVKSFTSGEYFSCGGISSSPSTGGQCETCTSTFVQNKLRLYDKTFVDHLLGQYFAFFGFALPGGDFSTPSSMKAMHAEEVTCPYGQDYFIPAIASFDALTSEMCNIALGDRINFMRLKSRVFKPVTGVMKLFAENKSFSTALIALYQCRISIDKFGAVESFSKLCVSRTFSFLNNDSSSEFRVTNMTKNEYSLVLWFSIIMLYLPLLVASFVQAPSSAAAGNKRLSYSERRECFQIVCKGFDVLWKDIYDQAASQHDMLNQNVASGVLVLLVSLVVYDCLSIQLKDACATLSSGTTFSWPENESNLQEDVIQKVMENLYNGLQLKQNVVNEVCISLLHKITGDVYDMFYSRLREPTVRSTSSGEHLATLSSSSSSHSWSHVTDKFFDGQLQQQLLKNLQRVLLVLMQEAEPENSCFRKACENRRDSTLSSIPNLSVKTNSCWKQAISIMNLASNLYLTLLLAEVVCNGVNAGGMRDLRMKRTAIVSTIVEGFPAVDDDNVTCVDLWLKCVFWSSLLSKVHHMLEFNVGGKGAAVKRVFTMSLLDASAVSGGATDVFTIWAGTLSTACLQPNILSEIGFCSLHLALRSPMILQCMPSKYSFTTQCVLRMTFLRAVDVTHFKTTERLKEVSPPATACPPDSASRKLSLPKGAMEASLVAQQMTDVDWQLFTLCSFATTAAVHLNDLKPGERSDVKERQFKPIIDMFHRCLRSLEDRMQYTSFTTQQILRRAICTISGRILGGVLMFVSPEHCSLDLYSSYHILSLLELQLYARSLSSLNKSTTPDIKVCLLLRLLPVIVSGVSFTKYSTTFFATWTPLLLMLPSTRAVSLRKLRECITHIWALSLLNPFVSAPFVELGSAMPVGKEHVSLCASVPSQLRQMYNDACQVACAFPTASELAIFESQSASQEFFSYVPNASSYTLNHGQNTTYVSNKSASSHSGIGNAHGGSAALSNAFSSAGNVASFHAFQDMWKSRMQGFCEYVLCNDVLWLGKDHQSSASASSSSSSSASSGASHDRWRVSTTAARVDLVMDVVNTLCQQARGDLSHVEEAGKQLLVKLKRSIMHIALIQGGRILRYLLGDGVADILSEEVDMSQQLAHVECAMIDQCSYHMFLCHRVVNDVSLESTADATPRLNVQGAVSTDDMTKWKAAVSNLCQVLTRNDQPVIDLVAYHCSVTAFLTVNRSSTSSNSSAPDLLVEELTRIQRLLQPEATGGLYLRRGYSDTLEKTVELIRAALPSGL